MRRFAPLVSFMADTLHQGPGGAGVAEGAPQKRHLVSQSPTRDVAEVGYNSKVEGDVVVTKVDAALNWFKKNSLWPMPRGMIFRGLARR
jgi:hypothetical protein